MRESFHIVVSSRLLSVPPPSLARRLRLCILLFVVAHGAWSALRELSAANDDYDTALHVVESIRRKALTASRAALSGHHRDLLENESDSSEEEGEDGAGYGRATSDMEENAEVGDSDDDEDDDDEIITAAASVQATTTSRELKLENQARGPETHFCAQKASSTPAPPLKQQQQRHLHDAPMNKHLEMLRIEPMVELHRSSSGRCVRLKHISQVGKEVLSPHALTPRALSGKRPTERPSSWSSSLSSSSSAVNRFEDATSSFRRPQPHRSISIGSSISVSPMSTETVTAYSSASTASSFVGHVRKMEPSSATTPAGRYASYPQQLDKLSSRKPSTNQERRCSFTISELALKEMSFSRSTPGTDTAPISECNQFNKDPFSAQGQLGENEGVTEEQEKEEKVVYRFDLWKKAGKSRQLPDAISTRQLHQQAQSKHASNNKQEHEEEEHNHHQRSQKPKELQQQQFGGEDDRRSKESSDMRNADSTSLCPIRKRSPTISVARSSRSFASASACASPSTLPLYNAIAKWKRGELIGEGTFGKVYMGLNSITGELFAVKEIEVRSSPNIADAKQLQKLGEEIELMNNLNHKHIVRYKGSHRTDNSFYIFMEYVPGGSIASMLKQFDAFSEDLIKIFTRQIVEGVMYLHAMGAVHRDIKGANVLVNEQGVSKLADFGCSKQLPQLNAAQSSKTTHHSPTKMHTASLEESLRSIRGSVPWMAPEVVKQTGHGFKADIWSIGATVIEMATARHPWPGATNSLFAMYATATATSPPPLPEHLSKDALAFLQRCFCIDPEERATAVELSRHPFLTS